MKKLILTVFGILMVAVVFAQSSYPLVKISDIQKVNQQDLAAGNDASPMLGDTVQLEGIVTFDPCLYGLSSGPNRLGTFLQDTAGGPWSGIHVEIDPGAIGLSDLAQLDQDTTFIDNFKKGNFVRCTGIVTTYSNFTQVVLLPIETQILSLGTVPPAHVTTIDTFSKADGAGGQIAQVTTGEQYEGMLVEFHNVTITNVSTFAGGTRINWAVQDANGNLINIRDVSGWFRNDQQDNYCTQPTATPWQFPLPNEGSQLKWIKGVIWDYALGGVRTYWITPRDTVDIGPLAAAAPVIRDVSRDPVVASSTQPVTISAYIEDPDGSITKASLFYSKGQGNTNFTEIPMVNTSGNNYSASIPAANQNNQFVNYWIRAIDNSNDTTDYPATNSTSLFYITKDGGITKISDLQYTVSPSGASIWAGDSIPNMNIHAVVTASQKTYDLGVVAIQDSRNPYSGIFLQGATGDSLSTLNRGDSIMITSGTVTESYGLTYLTSPTFKKLGKGHMPAPITGLNPDSINAQVSNQAEAYEGMFLRFDNVTVVDTNADASSGSNYGEWRINTSNSLPGMRCDDLSNDIASNFNTDSLSVGQNLSYIQGILDFDFGDFKLLPRNKSDIGGFKTNYPKQITVFAFLNLNGNDVYLNIDDANNLITTGSPLAAGTDVSALVPTIEFQGDSISPAKGVAQDFSDTVYYTVTAPLDGSTKTYAVVVDVATGIDAPANINSLQLAPNPTNGRFNVDLNVSKAGDYHVKVINIIGSMVADKNYHATVGKNIIPMDISNLPQGVYIVNIESKAGNFSKKLQLIK